MCCLVGEPQQQVLEKSGMPISKSNPVRKGCSVERSKQILWMHRENKTRTIGAAAREPDPGKKEAREQARVAL